MTYFKKIFHLSVIKFLLLPIVFSKTYFENSNEKDYSSYVAYPGEMGPYIEKKHDFHKINLKLKEFPKLNEKQFKQHFENQSSFLHEQHSTKEIYNNTLNTLEKEIDRAWYPFIKSRRKKDLKKFKKLKEEREKALKDLDTKITNGADYKSPINHGQYLPAEKSKGEMINFGKGKYGDFKAGGHKEIPKNVGKSKGGYRNFDKSKAYPGNYGNGKGNFGSFGKFKKYFKDKEYFGSHKDLDAYKKFFKGSRNYGKFGKGKGYFGNSDNFSKGKGKYGYKNDLKNKGHTDLESYKKFYEGSKSYKNFSKGKGSYGNFGKEKGNYGSLLGKGQGKLENFDKGKGSYGNFGKGKGNYGNLHSKGKGKLENFGKNNGYLGSFGQGGKGLKAFTKDSGNIYGGKKKTGIPTRVTFLLLFFISVISLFSYDAFDRLSGLGRSARSMLSDFQNSWNYRNSIANVWNEDFFWFGNRILERILEAEDMYGSS